MSDVLTRRPWRSLDVPDDVLSVPTMLAADELALLYFLARDYATGEGAIVDAGCFLGGSSAALLAGLRDREAPWEGPPVASYDLFQVEEYTLDEFFADDARLAVGDSFRPRYDRNVAGFDAPHIVHEGDISAHGWSGGPIEVLFLDVLKSPAINDAVLRDFFPHVVPGRTLIVHQDYEWGHVPWLHMSVELMRDSLRWIDAVPHCTHMFLVERPIPAELLEISVWHDLGADEQLHLMDRAIESNSGRARGMIELSKAVLLAHLGRLVDALQLLVSVDRRYRDTGVTDCGDKIRNGLRALELPRALNGDGSPEGNARQTVSGGAPAELAWLDPGVPKLDVEKGEAVDEVEAAAIGAVVLEYRDALAAGDARRACAVLSCGLRRHMVGAPYGAPVADDASDELLADVVGRIPAARRQAIAGLAVVGVHKQGNYAFVTCSISGGGRLVVPVRQEREEWKMAAIRGWPRGAAR